MEKNDKCKLKINDTKNENIYNVSMKERLRKYAKIIYFFADLVITFTVLLFSLFTAARGTYDLKTAIIFISADTLLVLILFLIFRVYTTLVLDFGLLDACKIAAIVLGCQFIAVIVSIFIQDLAPLRTYIFALLLASFTLVFFLVGIRAAVRIVYTLFTYSHKTAFIRTIVVGAGSAGKILIDDSYRNKNNSNKIVAFVDDDVTKIGKRFASLPVEGPISNIASIVEKYNAREIIIAIADLSKERLHEIISYLDNSDVKIRRMPLLDEMEGPNDVRVINVDIDDLLNRDPIKLDNSEVKTMLNQKVVLVTGAGGSIGSELVRQIFATHPKTLVLFDIYENSTYEIQQELVRKMRNENIEDINLVTLIGSTYNESRIESVIKKYRPDYIYHAAAYKHVPLMEDSPMEAIRTNVIGTYNVAKLADKYEVKKMVLVSTDKAVRPTNVMGATKRFAETIIQYFAEKSEHTSYAAVRFGNVLGSNGSVVPLFKRQIEEGGPVTITDKNIIRYFMTIPEAVSLILQCGLYAVGGEIFILDMGKPVKILDLAYKLIRQAGLIPEADIKIVETGLRPGEKLYEELLLDITTQTKTKNKRIYIEEKEPIKPIEAEIIEISKVFNMEENKDIKKLLSTIIDTYKFQK